MTRGMCAKPHPSQGHRNLSLFVIDKPGKVDAVGPGPVSVFRSCLSPPKTVRKILLRTSPDEVLAFECDSFLTETDVVLI